MTAEERNGVRLRVFANLREGVEEAVVADLRAREPQWQGSDENQRAAARRFCAALADALEETPALPMPSTDLLLDFAFREEGAVRRIAAGLRDLPVPALAAASGSKALGAAVEVLEAALLLAGPRPRGRDRMTAWLDANGNLPDAILAPVALEMRGAEPWWLGCDAGQQEDARRLCEALAYGLAIAKHDAWIAPPGESALIDLALAHRRGLGIVADRVRDGLGYEDGSRDRKALAELSGMLDAALLLADPRGRNGEAAQ